MPVKPTPVRARFWSKVRISDKPGECWEWTGWTNEDGYGLIKRARGRVVMAHRVAYEELVGPIEAELVLDHLCCVRNCVNPEHLEQVTRGENTVRGAQRRLRRCRWSDGPPAGLGPLGNEWGANLGRVFRLAHRRYKNHDAGSGRCRVCDGPLEAAKEDE